MDVHGSRRWVTGARLGGGGFGQVFRATGEDGSAVAIKFVPKQPGADRELLFTNPSGARNVMPVLDTGEHEDDLFIVMPLAERSLADEIAAGAPLELPQVIEIMRDVATALADLADNGVVHRDLKPDNVLAYDGHWVLADFGISRFAEASTAADTHKYMATPAYNAPERWRGERATSAADVYSLGIMAYELVSGGRPFQGPAADDYRHQHLHEDAPTLSDAPPRLIALIDESLDKSPQARPTPANILGRLDKVAQATSAPGAAALAQAYQVRARQAVEDSRRASEAQTEEERRERLLRSAGRSLANIQEELRALLAENAPRLRFIEGAGGWDVSLGSAQLRFTGPTRSNTNWGGWQAPAMDVIAHATLMLNVPATRTGYTGREHSLWFCNAQDEGAYGWFETAFMDMPLIRAQTRAHAPFALPPGEASAKALWNGMAEYQLAWPFTRLQIGDLDEFCDRWLGWFALADQGRLQYPSSMPERDPAGSWRTS